MKTILTVLTMLASIASFGQNSQNESGNDRKSGKYLSFKDRDNYLSSNWRSKTEDYEINLKLNVEKVASKDSNFDYSSDYIVVDVAKFIYHGKNLKNYFPKNFKMSALSSRGGTTFNAHLKDPNTKQDVIGRFTVIDKNTLKLRFFMDFYDISKSKEDYDKGTLFPKESFTIKKTK